MTTNEHNIIWVNQAESRKGWPVFCEEVFTGAFHDALERISNLAKGAGFMVGQVLSKDGKVLANVAPQGSIRLSSE
jgi:transposase-like protein